MDFPSQVTESHELKQTSFVAESEQRYLATLKAGTNVIKKIVPIRASKTHKQCKAIFGLAFALLECEFKENGLDSSDLFRLPKPSGVLVSKDMFRQYFYACYPIKDADGKPVTLSGMNIKEAGEWFERIIAHASSYWGIFIPDTNVNWKDEK